MMILNKFYKTFNYFYRNPSFMVLPMIICLLFYFTLGRKLHCKVFSKNQAIYYDSTAALDLQKCEIIINENLYIELKNLTKYKDPTNDYQVEKITNHDCKYIIHYYSFEVEPTLFTEEERNYPIAYSILVHHNAQQLMFLLSQIYAPHNVYCVHLDAKAPLTILKTLKRVEKCFPNIRISSKREYVVYASYSRLQADINCMQDLLNSSVSWSYLINLSGQDFPIKTNAEVAKTLKALKGKNVIPRRLPNEEIFRKRTEYVWRITKQKNKIKPMAYNLTRTFQLKSPPPFNITIWKSLAYNVFSRPFLRWVLEESEKAKALLEWSRDTRTPDEHYWASLNALEEAPGGSGKQKLGRIDTYVQWKHKKICEGYWRHYSCVFGTGDLPRIMKSNRLFANKFDIKFDAKPIVCLRKWLNERKLITLNKR